MANNGYLEFRLDIGPGSQGEYPLAVLESPVGEARETMHFPFTDLGTEFLIERLTMQSEREIRELGQKLFDALFSGQLRSLYDTSRQQAVAQNKGLRLTLSIRPPELIALPWEVLYDARQGEYLARSPATSIVRYLEPAGIAPPEPSALPLRILAMIATPADLPPLDAKSEVRRLLAAIQPLQSLGLAEVKWVVDQTWPALQEAFWSGTWHAFHFVGYGGFDQRTEEDLLILADDEGRSHLLNAGRLGQLLAGHSSLRLVVLSSGAGVGAGPPDRFSTMATGLVARGIPGVLALPTELDEQPATGFIHSLYQAWSTGAPLDQAVAEAREELGHDTTELPAWGTPALYTPFPELRAFDPKTLAASMYTLGSEALLGDDLELAGEQLALAIELGIGRDARQKKALAQEVHSGLETARKSLKTLDGSTEAQTDSIIALVKALETLDQRLPDSRGIQVELARVRERACRLRDHLWQESQRLIKAQAVGHTLEGRRKRTEKAVHLLKEATRLDPESLPALCDDLSMANLRLEYLHQAQEKTHSERNQWLRRYGVVGAGIGVVLILVLLTLQLLPATGQDERAAAVTSPVPSPVTQAVVELARTAALTPAQGVAADASPTTMPTLPSTAPPEPAIVEPTDTSMPSPLPPTDTATNVPATATFAPTHTRPPEETTSSASIPTEEPSPVPTLAQTEAPPPTAAIPTAEPPTIEAQEPSPTFTITTPSTTTLPTELIYPAPVLNEPEDTSLLSQSALGYYPLRWQWDGALHEDEWFDVRVWRVGTPHYGIAWTKEQEYLYDLCLQGGGEYYWSVAVVRGDQGQWLGDLSPEAAPHQFTSVRSNAWCERHGRYTLPVRSEPQ